MLTIDIKRLNGDSDALSIEDELKLDRLRSFGKIGAITQINSGNKEQISLILRKSPKKKFKTKETKSGVFLIWRTK